MSPPSLSIAWGRTPNERRTAGRQQGRQRAISSGSREQQHLASDTPTRRSQAYQLESRKSPPAGLPDL